jgi:hypothetical protein
MDELEQQSDGLLYTADDMIVPVDTSVNNYTVAKGISVSATGEPVEDKVNFNTLVNDSWRKISPERDNIDRTLASQAAVNGQPDVFKQTVTEIDNRIRMYGENNAENIADLRVKFKELAQHAAENVALNSSGVVENNSVEAITSKLDEAVTKTRGQAFLERIAKDGESLSTLAFGLGAEIFLPHIAIGQGVAIDSVVSKYGVSSEDVGTLTGRNQTVSYLQLAFKSLPPDENTRVEWLENLYEDLKSNPFITDLVAVSLVASVVGDETKTWNGWSDWLDRVGVAGSVVAGATAITKTTKLLGVASSAASNARTLASIGGKGAIIAAEAAKIESKAANYARLQAVGTIAGEATGISAAIDLGKLVGINPLKSLPESLTTASSELQGSITRSVNTLVDELQGVINAKGIRTEEAAEELAKIRAYYSPATNANIHHVDNFSITPDGLTITGKVYYKPEVGSSYANEAAAIAAVKTLDPDGKMGFKVVPDTTNTGFLVEEDVIKQLELDLTAKQAQLAELLVDSKPKRAREPKAEKAVTPVVDDLNPPGALILAKPRFKEYEVNFQDLIDKAAYQVGSKSTPSKSDIVVKEWLQRNTGWSDEQIAAHAKVVRAKLTDRLAASTPETPFIGVATIEKSIVKSQMGESGSTSVMLSSKEREEMLLTQSEGMTISGNTRVQTSSQAPTIIQFVERVGKALGMTDRNIVVLNIPELRKSALTNPLHKYYLDYYDSKHLGAGAVHIPVGRNTSVILMREDGSRMGGRRQFIETFAHEYGHAFEEAWGGKYSVQMIKAYDKWLAAKGIKSTGTGINKRIHDVFPLTAMMEYRSITNAADISRFVDDYYAGNVAAYKADEAQFRNWANSYSEFFAENFAKWAFTDEVPTSLLGQSFKSLVDGFKLIAENVITILAEYGESIVGLGKAEATIAKMLNDHIKLVEKTAAQSKANVSDVAKMSLSAKPSVETLSREISELVEQLSAVRDAKTGLKTGYLLERPINKNIDYSLVGKYAESDINSAARFAMGDWALKASSEQYHNRVVGLHAGSRYQKLFTEFVRPSIEKLSRYEYVQLDNVLVLGDKQGKVFTEAELAGQNLSPKAREAYFQVRALRDVLHAVRNDVAARSLTRRGFVEIKAGITLDDGSSRMFGKAETPKAGTFVYIAEKGTSARVSDTFLKSPEAEGLEFFTLAEPLVIDGKYRKTIALSKGRFDTQKAANVVPYRVGEYRRIYTDEYFLKFVSQYEVDGVMQEVVTTHRTAGSMGDARAYKKSFDEAVSLFKAGKLTNSEATRLMQPFGWQPDDLLEALSSNKFGQDFKLEVRYNRTDDDYTSEALGLAHNLGSKRGDKVLSVHGEDATNTVSPLDSIAAEISNTAYVASTTEWRESNIVRWFNTFQDIFPKHVQEMSADDAFAYFLNPANRGLLVKQDKKAAIAENVHQYIVSQMQIATEEEKAFVGTMRLISENIEGKAGNNKLINNAGVFLRNTESYPSFLRNVAFNSYFLLNPVQFFMQGMNAFNAMALSPVHGLAAAKSSSLYALALFSDQESIWRQVATANKISNLGLGMETDEFVEVVRSIRRSGLMDGINSTSLYGAETGKYGISNQITRRARGFAALPFNSGEGYSRLVSFDIARREFMTANPGAAWWTDDSVAKIIARQDDLTQNMTQANTASWQKGWKSIPAQFQQYSVKILMNVGQSLLGNTRTFTRAEAARLMVAHALVMGTAGNLLMPFIREPLGEAVNENIESETARLAIQQGVVSGAIAALTDGDVQLGIGSRFNTFRIYEDLIGAILSGEGNFFEIVGGPSGAAGFRMLKGVGESLTMFASAPLDVTTVRLAANELAKSSFSFYNNLEKAYIISNSYNTVRSNSGDYLYEVTEQEIPYIAMGLPVAEQEDFNIMFSSAKKRNALIMKTAKVVGEYSMLSEIARKNGDMKAFEAYQAVVRASIAPFKGAEYTRLMDAASKTQSMTKYREMLIEQAASDFSVGDVLVDTGVSE